MLATHTCIYLSAFTDIFNCLMADFSFECFRFVNFSNRYSIFFRFRPCTGSFRYPFLKTFINFSLSLSLSSCICHMQTYTHISEHAASFVSLENEYVCAQCLHIALLLAYTFNKSGREKKDQFEVMYSERMSCAEAKQRERK